MPWVGSDLLFELTRKESDMLILLRAGDEVLVAVIRGWVANKSRLGPMKESALVRRSRVKIGILGLVDNATEGLAVESGSVDRARDHSRTRMVG